MISFIILKSERSHHGKITKNVQIHTDITILIKYSKFCRRSKYMHSSNPIFKLSGFILCMVKGGSKTCQHTIPHTIPHHISGDVLSMIGSPYCFGKKKHAINAGICHNSFKSKLSHNCITKESSNI